MLNKKFKDAIIKVAKELDKNNIQFFVIGSTNHALQGMNVEPNDLDILVNYNVLDKIKDIFKGFKIKEEKESQNCESKKVLYEIDGVEVEFCCEYEHGIYIRNIDLNDIIYVTFDDMKIPCYKLQKEAQIYKKFGRVEKAERISNFIKDNQE
jgi:predicted nucleotidyltransferase